MNKILILLFFASFNLFATTFNVSTTTELRQALSDAAGNGQDDVIVIADGTYKTTDDGLGTFIFLDTESYKLTMRGSHQDNVILSGDSTDQILNFNSTNSHSILEIDSLSFVDGYTVTLDGGGIFTNHITIINRCNFLRNTGRYGGGLIVKDLNIKDSIIKDNISYWGGGFRSTNAIVNNTIFDGNSATLTDGGGFSSYYGTINNSIFVNNLAARFSAAFNIEIGSVSNSIFINNSSGIYIGRGVDNSIINNIFLNNSSHDIDGGSVAIATIYNNYIDVSNIFITGIKSNNIFSTVNLGFLDQVNNDFRLTSTSDFIDAGIVDIFLPDTDFDGFARLAGGSVDIGPFEFSTTRPTINSATFTGTAKEQSELTFSVDYTLEPGRTIVGVSYDYLNDGIFITSNLYTYNTAGAYTVKAKVLDNEGEFSIASIPVVVVELPYNEMTYEQKLIKAIDPVYYTDLIGLITTDKDTAVSAASTTGIATGKQYVQDNINEFSLVTVADKDTAVTEATTTGIATGKQYVQDNLTEFSLVTVADKDTAVTEATTTGIATGKQYVQDNLTEFSLVTVADKDTAVSAAIIAGQQEVISNPPLFGIDAAIPLLKSTIDNLTSGWHSLGTVVEITNLSIFDNAKIVWYFDSNTESWLAYSSNQATQAAMAASGITTIMAINENSGIWVEK